jgi:hypothetical protein
MTGVVGASTFLLLITTAAYSTMRRWRLLAERQKLEIASFAGFWAVHLGAEGYIYGVGSLLGLTFWLWLGRLLDQLDEAAPMRTSRTQNAHRPRLTACNPRALR